MSDTTATTDPITAGKLISPITVGKLISAIDSDDQARLWEELRREFDAIENDRYDASRKRFANLAQQYFIIEL